MLDKLVNLRIYKKLKKQIVVVYCIYKKNYLQYIQNQMATGYLYLLV